MCFNSVFHSVSIASIVIGSSKMETLSFQYPGPRRYVGTAGVIKSIIT